MKNQIECLKQLFNGETLLNSVTGEKIKYHTNSGEIIRISDDRVLVPDFSCPDVWHVSYETKIEFLPMEKHPSTQDIIDKINEIIKVVNRLNEKTK